LLSKNTKNTKNTKKNYSLLFILFCFVLLNRITHTFLLVATESTVGKAKVLKVELHNLFAVAAVRAAAKVLLVQATPFAREAFVGRAENLQCRYKLADDAQAAVVAREQGDDTLNVDFIRLRPILRCAFRLLAVVLSQNLDVAHAKQFARRAVFHLAVHMFHLAERGSTVGNAV